MKLAEALIVRKDLQTRLEELRERLILNALVQEDEEPAEKPKELLIELDKVTKQLEDLMTRINLTNAAVSIEESSLTAMLAKRECEMHKLSILRRFLNEANNTVLRSSRLEVKIYSTVSVAELRKQTDRLSEALRKLDMTIQAANWATDLQE